MKISDQTSGETYSEAETVDRREAALKRLLAMPPEPRKASKGKPKVRSKSGKSG